MYWCSLVPEQVLSPDILLLAAGLRTPLYTSTLPAPEIAARDKHQTHKLACTFLPERETNVVVLEEAVCWSVK